MSGYIRVAAEGGSESIELPLETDSTLLFSTLKSAFPKASGLKYRTDNNSQRGVRLFAGRFYPPEDGWGDKIIVSVMCKEEKRKAEDCPSRQPVKKRAVVSDLIILGLAWRTTEDNVRRYFEGFGEVTMAIIKIDQATGLSKGFGFVRFRDPVVQTKVISQRHFIDGRWCDVKIPNNHVPDASQACKIFVGQLTPDTTAVELREYFSGFGEVADIFIPQPFRMFAFVTFARSSDAKSVCETKGHSINGIPINVSEAMPLNKTQKPAEKNLRYTQAQIAAVQTTEIGSPLLNFPLYQTWDPTSMNGVPYFWSGLFPNNFIPS